MNLKLVKLQLLISGLLSAILVAEYGYGLSATRRLQQSLQFSKDDSPAVSELPSISTLKPASGNYNELVERPLFIEGRKPIVEAITETTQNADNAQIDDWELVGIYTKGKKTSVLFAKKNETHKFLKIGVEQTVSGWLLKEIQPDRVVLQQAAQMKTVMLRKPRADNPAAPAAGKPPIPPKPLRPATQAPHPNPEQAHHTNPENVNDDSQKN
jgi:hypothetical protein